MKSQGMKSVPSIRGAVTLQDIADAETAMALVPGAFDAEKRALLRERKLRLLKEASR